MDLLYKTGVTHRAPNNPVLSQTALHPVTILASIFFFFSKKIKEKLSSLRSKHSALGRKEKTKNRGLGPFH